MKLSGVSVTDGEATGITSVGHVTEQHMAEIRSVTGSERGEERRGEERRGEEERGGEERFWF